MTAVPAHLVTSDYELAIECRNCGKTAKYEQKMSLDTWNQALIEFRRQHKNCPPKRP